MKTFQEILDDRLNSCRSNEFSDNYDFRRFGPKRTFTISNLKKAVRSTLAAVGVLAPRGDEIRRNLDKLAWLYERLDEESSDLLIQLLCFRLLGERRVKLPLNSAEYWQKLAELEQVASEGEAIELGYFGWRVNRINLEQEGYPIEMFARPTGAYNQMVLQQYRCQTPTAVIEVEPGDIAIDAGACFGDTALNFAFKAGASGRVYSWEFMPDNLEIFDRNMQLNPQQAARIELVRHPLWSVSGQDLYVTGFGPGAKVTPTKPRRNGDASVVQTYTIDDLCSDRDLDRIDFIKMDIEGAELEALKGARETIRQCRPKLAISLYHHVRDFWEIPQWIDSLDLGYRLYLRHFTIHSEETVLFAVADQQ